MKILLVCAAGLSTSILMKKLEKYAEQNGIELDIDAVGIGEIPAQDYGMGNAANVLALAQSLLG